MQAYGHHIQPIAFHHHTGPYQIQDEALKERTLYLCDHSNILAFKALSLIRPSLIQGLKFALLQQGLPLKSLLGNALKLAYLAKKNHCDHFHAHFSLGAAATAIVAARLCGATVSFVGHGHDIYATPQDLSLKLNAVDFAVAVCLDMAADFKKMAPEANISLIYCGIDIARFITPYNLPLSCTQQLVAGLDPENNLMGKDQHRVVKVQKKLLFIGRLCETKGLFTLLKALYLINGNKRPCIDIVGEGILRSSLEQYVHDHKLNQYVTFLGSKQSSWFINNSSQYAAMVAPFEMAINGDRDTGPVVIKEAMALKLPVITTFFMGCNEFLTGSCGLRVPPEEPVKLAGMIEQFYAMPASDVQAMCHKAYNRVRTYYSAELQACCLSGMIENQNV
jgi:glycosyltransferase involved in cell wall biosynthesis